MDSKISPHQITLEAKIENWKLLQDFLEAGLDSILSPFAARQEIFLCAEEIFVNVSSYAYEETGKVTVLAEWNAATRELTLQFQDSGKPYNPLERDDPDITLAAEDRQIGGLGVFLVKKLTDSIIYEYSDGKNVLTIKKRIAAES